MQCICSTGIRVSELKYITIESLGCGKTEINNKGKIRVILLPSKLCKALKSYAKKKKIKSGPVFVSKNGNPLDRSNIWSSMKKLCELAGVAESKVYPHNLRHLFARTYYSIQKDIVRLADILGHSSINTTRIYTPVPCCLNNPVERKGILWYNVHDCECQKSSHKLNASQSSLIIV